jgi:hypothetical protein
MTIDEFHYWVKGGKQLVVIDNLILDQGAYADVHPGGKFSIKHTVGRDISKYFYGGFSLLNPELGRPPYTHSLKALNIAEGMVIAGITGQEKYSKTVVTRIVKKVKNNNQTHSFCFETLDLKPVENFSNFFEDLSFLGRHYLLSASSDPTMIRQYTVCNAFIPEFYLELFKLC